MELAQHWQSWILFATLLTVFGYTMWVVKREPQLAKKFGHRYDFQGFSFSTPSWWKKKAEGTHLIRFERPETNYQFSARFELSKQRPRLAVLNFMEKYQIKFDSPELEQNILQSNLKGMRLANSLQEFYRMEGLASLPGHERRYYDLCALRLKGTSDTLICIHESSVLSGTIEGPYFESVIKSLEKA